MRIGAVAAKEFWALVRQPQLLLLLLVGPVAIMVAFGLSLDVRSILRPDALVVVEPGSEGAEIFERFRDDFAQRTNIVGTTDDLESARQRLRRGEVDAVIAVPSDPLGRVEDGEQAVLRVLYNTINPVFGTRVPARSFALVLELNQNIVERSIGRSLGDLRSIEEGLAELERRLEAASATAESLSSEEAQATTAELEATLADLEGSLDSLQAAETGEVGEVAAALEGVRAAQEALGRVQEAQDEGVAQVSGLAELQENLNSVQEALAALPADASPQVLANPLRLETENLATPPEVVGYYAPGVLALLIQHIALSLASLAVVRERLRGTYEFFGVSPLGYGELLAGQALTYFGLVLGVNLAVAVALAAFLGIPVEGGYLSLTLAMVLLTIASLGLGFAVSALAKSQLQAIQVAMLLFIASGFFAGFLFPLGQMGPVAVAISYLLPASYGIRALQDVMIRGETVSSFDLLGLLAISAITLGIARYYMSRKKG
ncbi:MAG: ABC transporter permease [Actinomycetota bacterium]|nr:ABC transporter permease [Actinomycetota bacterium]